MIYDFFLKFNLKSYSLVFISTRYVHIFDAICIMLNMKTSSSSSKPAISTSPDNHCSLHNIKYCPKILSKCVVRVFHFFL